MGSPDASKGRCTFAHDILTAEPSQLNHIPNHHPSRLTRIIPLSSSPPSPKQAIPYQPTLLLLLLRRLGSLLLQVLDGLLRVLVVATVGLDGALAVTRETLVPLALALLLLLQLLLLQLLGFFGAGLVVCAWKIMLAMWTGLLGSLGSGIMCATYEDRSPCRRRATRLRRKS